MKKLFILLFILAGCSPLPPLAAWNWQPGHHEESPGLVAITINPKNIKHFCTGIVIKPNTVLTAAHCLDNYPANQMWITYNCDIITDTSCKHTRGKRSIFHPWYSHGEGIWNDLGVIIAEKNINVKPALIGSVEDVRKAKDFGIELYTAGFGRRLNGDIGILYSGTIKIRQEHVYEFYTTNNDISGACKGDSGGPAYFMDFNGHIKVVGILSRAQNTASCGGKAIYTIPTMYMDWVDSMLIL